MSGYKEWMGMVDGWVGGCGLDGNGGWVGGYIVLGLMGRVDGMVGGWVGGWVDTQYWV